LQGVLAMLLDPVGQVVSSVGAVGPQQFQPRELAGRYPPCIVRTLAVFQFPHGSLFSPHLSMAPSFSQTA
jgi:hypothetical protein